MSELFRLGDEAAGDSILFGGIGELIAVDGAGRIFVGETQDPKIYAFTADGNLIETIGSQGSAPGEFERLGSIHAGPGDTLYVFDNRSNRMSVYKPDDLELAYDFTVARDSLGSPYNLVGVLDTSFLITFGLPATPDDATHDRRLYLMRVDWTGQIMPPPVHDLPASEWLVLITADFRSVMRTPFGRNPVLRMGSDGKLYAGWTESVDIAVLTPDGVQSAAVTHTLASIQVTRQESEQYIETLPALIKSHVVRNHLPATKPAYETFVVDDHGRVWVKATPPLTSDTTQWLVLGEDNRLRGQLRLPATVNLRVIRGDRAYAEDRGDVTTLVVYRIED